MTVFLLLAALMIAAALAFVVVPLMRHARDTHAVADTTRRLRALDEAMAAGVIDADEYAAKRAAIAKVEASPKPDPAQKSRTAFTALLAVALVLPASALLLYRLVGEPNALDPANYVAAPSNDAHAANMQQAIAGLAAKLKQNPDDAQGWALLGRAYQATDRIDEAREAFKQAHEHAPNDADLAVEYAQTLALAAPDHLIQGEPRTLIEGALKNDPRNQRGLWLLGISDYQVGKYDAAIATWNTLLPLLAPDSDVARSVKNEIADAEARRDGKTPPAPVEAPDEASASNANESATPSQPAGNATAASTVRLTVNVALDPKLKGKLDANATLFVFARAASGPPMPLAIQRLKASQLPATVTLDDSMGMMPTMKLSMFPQVVVGARISKSGNAMPQSGDLQTLSPPTDVHRSDAIALTIDQVVP